VKEKFDVLVIDSRYKHSLAAVRCLGKHDLNILSGSAKFSPTKFSRFSKKSFRYDNENFERDLIEQLEKYDVDLVVPIDYKSNIKCSKIAGEIRKYSNIVIADYDKMIVASNKEKMIEILNNTKINFPKSYVVKNKKDIGKISVLKKMAIKSAEEERGEKVEYVESGKDLAVKLEERLEHGTQIVQEYVEGFGCAFFALCDNGKVLQSFQHKRIRQYPESGGVSSVAESFYDKNLEKCGEEIIGKLKWTGVCMVEFICDEKNGKYYFIEFNPKFWGSLDLSISCGIEFPYLLYRFSKGEEIVNLDYESGRRFQWVLPEDTIRIRSAKNKWDAMKDWGRDFFGKKTKSDFGYIFNDPIPTLIRMVGAFYKLIIK